MSRKPSPILKSNLLYEMGQDFLDIQYVCRDFLCVRVSARCWVSMTTEVATGNTGHSCRSSSQAASRRPPASLSAVFHIPPEITTHRYSPHETHHWFCSLYYAVQGFSKQNRDAKPVHTNTINIFKIRGSKDYLDSMQERKYIRSSYWHIFFFYPKKGIFKIF